MCVNDLPKVVTWQLNGHELNSRYLNCKSGALTTTSPSHTDLYPHKRNVQLTSGVNDISINFPSIGIFIGNHLSTGVCSGIRGAFKKFCNLTIKKIGNVTNYTLFFNIIPTEFSACATFFWQTVNSTKIGIFCLSLQPLLDSFLERFIVRIADRCSESSATWHDNVTRNTLDCDQSNYSSRMVFPSYLLNLAKPEIALFDPPTPKIPS